MQPDEQSELVFYIRHQGGFTARLYQYALEHPSLSVPVLVDGPYGGINLQKYYGSDHVLVIAGGSGAGWCLPFIEQFARYGLLPADEEHGQTVPTDIKETLPAERLHGSNHSGPLSVRVILATRDVSSRTWFLRTVRQLLSKSSGADSSSDVRVQVYLTREAVQNIGLVSEVPDPSTSTGSASSADKINIPEDVQEDTIQGREFEGRPQLPLIIQEEAATVAEAGQSLSVFVCGPSTMQNDVRNAVAKENLNIIKGSKARGVYLYSEHFSWA